MVVGAKTVAAGVTAVSMVSLLSGLSIYFRPQAKSNDIMDVLSADQGQVAGRVVSVPVKVYRDAFKATLKLGQCPLIMENNSIKTCTDEFTGTEVLLAKAGLVVDVSRVQSSEDILQHIMGGLGVSVGVLGLASVKVKVNVAVTTETKRENLNLMSSYNLNKGVVTLHNPKPKEVVGKSALYLSEIELGGNELLLVTLEFESVKEKIEVEITVTVKILFISISAKIRFVHETFKSKAKVRIQFKSSWRQELDESFDNLGAALPRIEEIEKMYMQGPELLRDMKLDDERSHNFYYFSSWKQTPYEGGLNQALASHDVDFLTEQNTELLSVANKINKLKDQSWSADQRREIVQLNQTVTTKSSELTKGLDTYHKLTPADRQKLRDIYGQDKAPLFYDRELNKIFV